VVATASRRRRAQPRIAIRPHGDQLGTLPDRRLSLRKDSRVAGQSHPGLVRLDSVPGPIGYWIIR
jgi:hypothetical protein